MVLLLLLFMPHPELWFCVVLVVVGLVGLVGGCVLVCVFVLGVGVEVFVWLVLVVLDGLAGVGFVLSPPGGVQLGRCDDAFFC